MADITRIGSPTTDDLRTWTVPLSAPPSRKWTGFFNRPQEPTTIQMPSLVSFRGAALSFQSDEGQLPEWIRCIDVWIGNANRQQAEEVQQADSDRDRREDANRQRQEDIRRVNEKFKNL